MKNGSSGIFTGAILSTVVLLVFSGASYGQSRNSSAAASHDWPVYNGGPSGDHYSQLTQINRQNVHSLRVAWKFDTEEGGGLEANPIIVGGVLYTYTPSQEVIALDAASGKLLWRFSSGIHSAQPARGVAYWTDGKESRILATVSNFLYALDAATGNVIPSFGEAGRVDLRKELRGDYRAQSISPTSPGIVYKDLFIIGGRNPETHPSPPGDIRAFDIYSGSIRWTFHTIPHPGEFGYDTWPKDAWLEAGAANNWGGMALDVSRGIVYVPTGSAVPDFYGADRVGDNLFADTLLALDASTGKRIWHFQGVHHDVWDRDFPSPPSLLTIERNGKKIDAIAQTSKQGFVYLFNRTNGDPLFPIKESSYPPSTVPGEVTAATQPLPILPLPFARQQLTEDVLTDRTPEMHAWAVEQLKTYRNAGQFTPLNIDQQTVVFPGTWGGGEWGGAAVDPTTGILYVNSNEMAWTLSLTENRPSRSQGESIYQNQCSVCHQNDRAGSPPNFPSLIGIDKRLTDQQIGDTIHQGRGRMPPFNSLNDEQTMALLHYLKNPDQTNEVTNKTTPTSSSTRSRNSAAYRFTGFRRFIDLDGYPAIKPPWGTLNAIDLKTGKYLWKIPLGQYPELVKKGMADTGSENFGGPVVTAGGLVLIAATIHDRKFRAFDSHSGKLLWEAELPFSGVATPSTYMVNGKQYIVIAAGGATSMSGLRGIKQSGGTYVAFALP
ncbi:MAG: PQQ-binding-like beta-propeller repeat protein [Granulicella sp.]